MVLGRHLETVTAVNFSVITELRTPIRTYHTRPSSGLTHTANASRCQRYQLNPDRLKDEVVTNVLVKAMTQFPSPQFSLALHLLNPTTAATGELAEAVSTLRDLNSALERAEYARFWSTLNGDDLCADLIADVADFEDMVRHRIAHLVSQAFREVGLEQLGAWLGLNAEGTKKFVAEVCEWEVEGDVVKVPSNPDNEAQKAEIREDVKIDMFSRVIKRSWEDAVAA